MNALEPNILYLDEKPPKIVKTKKGSTIKKSSKSSKIKPKEKLPLRKCASKEKNNCTIKKEFSDEEKMENFDSDDPLYTAKLEIKCELDDDDHNENYGIVNNDQEDFENDDDDDDEDYNYKLDIIENKFEKSEDNDGDGEDDYDNEPDEEDELLIVLSRKKGRRRKKIQHVEDTKVKAPLNVTCREICKQHCTDKFTEEQRKNICDYYWYLNKEDRLAFIRKHIRARRLTRMKRVNASRVRGNNCCYYLKPYKIGCEETDAGSSANLIRVCRKFFEATLCTTNHFIKKANDGTLMEIEKDLDLLNQIKLAREKERNKEPKQILDPETGNLITLDPNTNKITKPKSESSPDKTEKKKRVRRKPGDPQPEHFPKPINCALRCIYKCHENFTKEERKQICDFFWSMDYKRRKDFILANIEIKDIETQTTPDFRKSNRPSRTYQTRYFLRCGGMRGENVRVCKDFYEKTLCISRYFIENAIQFADKTTGYYTGTDRRGGHPATNKISEERKQAILEHIKSYPLWIPNKKTKTKYLHHSLSIKKMHDEYKEKCMAEKVECVSSQFYYKMFHDHFNLLFLSNPRPTKGHGLQKSNPNISHYTGDEPGGCWVDYSGNKLDLSIINPAKSFNISKRSISSDTSDDTSLEPNPFTSRNAIAAAHSASNVNRSNFMPLNSTSNEPLSLAVVRPDFNPAHYGNLAQDHINMFRMI